MALTPSLKEKLDDVFSESEHDGEEQIQILKTYQLLVAKEQNLNAAKINANTFGEQIVCREKGFVWNKDEVHGPDGWNGKQPIEIKVSWAMSSQANFTYNFPSVRPNDTAESYSRRVCKLWAAHE